MLFSNETLASMIDKQFEPVWVSLRPVPRVTIDFGNGNVIRRTLHGNVATWICAADGTALDALPGIYEPQTYTEALMKLKVLHDRFLNQDGKDGEKSALSRYYDEHLAASTEDRVSDHPATTGIRGLREDTRLNETVRRKTIHAKLRETGLVNPDKLTKWLYREVLNADLDDPYLGLGEKLFGNYPFVEEDLGS